MDYLFIHREMPGQFGRLAQRLAEDPKNRVVFLTSAERTPPLRVRRALYRTVPPPSPTTHRYIRGFEQAVLRGQMVARACLEMRRRGFSPDVVVAHPGWGEPIYVKDVFPATKLINYCEFFYRARGADVGFDPAETVDTDRAARVRTKNAALMIALEACDRGVSPTEWQRSVHPPEWQSKIEVIFDGVDAALARPDPAARFPLPDGTVLTPESEVVTYVARNLEPYRGFPSFMRALPAILEARPQARIVIVGGNGVSYGVPPADGRTWRQTMLDEVRPDPGRLHFIGKIAYRDYLRLLQVSTAHVYLTVPFVLSWSAMEALAAGCLFIGSRTRPVEEVVRHEENGLLVDLLSPEDIAARVIEALHRRDELGQLRRCARETVLGRYDLPTCLGRQLDLLRRVAGREPLPSTPAGADAGVAAGG